MAVMAAGNPENAPRHQLRFARMSLTAVEATDRRRRSPANSFASGASGCREPEAARLSSGEGTLVPDQPDLRPREDAGDEGIVLCPASRLLCMGVDRRVHRPAQSGSRFLDADKQVGVGERIAHHHHVHVARRAVLPPRDQAVDEGRVYQPATGASALRRISASPDVLSTSALSSANTAAVGFA